jgi:SP family facilitated glucose transporter-like MFS transporter 3
MVEETLASMDEGVLLGAAGGRDAEEKKGVDCTLTMPLLMAVVVAVMSQFLVGFNTSVLNGAGAVVFPDHTLLTWSVVVSSFAIGGPIGAIGGGILSSKRGRRGAMILNAWIFLAGGLMMALAPDVYWLVPARVVCGIASGASTVVVPVYLGEVAPPTLRGALGTLTQFAMVIGLFVSIVMAIFLMDADHWRYQFAFTPVLAAVQLLISSFLLESPRWLLGRNSTSRYYVIGPIPRQTRL